jgi:hypothetical protein
MPTATTAKEDSRSKIVQNHPHDFTKRLYLVASAIPIRTPIYATTLSLDHSPSTRRIE